MQPLTAGSLDVAERTTLTDDIVEKLINYIADNRLGVGDMLPSEKQLVDALGVSRLPLREALSRLRALGLISVRQGKGAFIRRVNVANLFRQISPILRSQGNLDVSHMIEVRLSLEPSVAGLAAGRRIDGALDELAECIANMELHLADKQQFIYWDMKFHRCLAQATGNPAFETLVSTVHDIMAATQSLYPDSADARGRSLGHHRRILQAVEERNAEAAAVAMDAHIRDIASVELA